MNPALLDISECSLRKVHNAFAKCLEAFGDTVETTLLDIYHFFKNSAVQSATLKATQRFLGLPENVLLRHVSSRCLTLSSALDRFIQQHEAVKETVLGAQQKSQAGGNIYRRLKENLMKKDLLPKAIFLRNVADVFVEFLTLFQRCEPLLHILYEEMVKLVKRILERFLLIGAYRDFAGVELQSLNVECSANWKQVVEIGADTENSINSFTPEEKKMFRLGARSFYIQVAKYLLSRLPFGNQVLKDLKSLHPSAVKEESAIVALSSVTEVPEVVPPQEVSALMDELTLLSTEEFSSNPHERLDDAWQHVFSLLSKDGGPKYPRTVKFVKAMLSLAHGNADVERGFSENRRLLHERSNLSIACVNGLHATKSSCSRYGQDASAVPLKPDMIKALKGSLKKYQERVSAECEPSAKKAKLHQDSVGNKVDEQRSIQMDINSAKKMLANAELLISKGMKAKKFDGIESGQALLKEGQAKLASSLSKLEDSKKKKSCARL